MSSSEPTTTILVAHGSRNPAAQDAHLQLVAAVSMISGRRVVPAYLELAEPSTSDAIDAAVASGAAAVHLLPCFLHPGNHVERDLPAIVAEARSRHADVDIELLAHVGADPALAELIAGSLAE